MDVSTEKHTHPNDDKNEQTNDEMECTNNTFIEADIIVPSKTNDCLEKETTSSEVVSENDSRLEDLSEKRNTVEKDVVLDRDVSSDHEQLNFFNLPVNDNRDADIQVKIEPTETIISNPEISSIDKNIQSVSSETSSSLIVDIKDEPIDTGYEKNSYRNSVVLVVYSSSDESSSDSSDDTSSDDESEEEIKSTKNYANGFNESQNEVEMKSTINCDDDESSSEEEMESTIDSDNDQNLNEEETKLSMDSDDADEEQCEDEIVSTKDCDNQTKGQQSGQSKKKKKRCTTRGEVFPEDLPPLEDLTLTPGAEIKMQPLGVVSGIVEVLVVIKANQNTPALYDDTVLFSENRSALGLVFELFGSVDQKYYSIRFNKAEDIQKKSIAIGDKILYAPGADNLTKYVFIKELEKEKYDDASWENDNETPFEFRDFSDDEEEIILRPIQKQIKKEARLEREELNRKKKLDEQTPMNESAESRGLLQGDLHKNPFKKKVKPIKPPKHFRQKQPTGPKSSPQSGPQSQGTSKNPRPKTRLNQQPPRPVFGQEPNWKQNNMKGPAPNGPFNTNSRMGNSQNGYSGFRPDGPPHNEGPRPGFTSFGPRGPPGPPPNMNPGPGPFGPPNMNPGPGQCGPPNMNPGPPNMNPGPGPYGPPNMNPGPPNMNPGPGPCGPPNMNPGPPNMNSGPGPCGPPNMNPGPGPCGPPNMNPGPQGGHFNYQQNSPSFSQPPHNNTGPPPNFQPSFNHPHRY